MAAPGLLSLVAAAVTATAVAVVSVGSSAASELLEKEALLELCQGPSRCPFWNETESASACGWRGVTCDDAGRVVQLELNGAGVSGTLPASWGLALPGLSVVRLESNALVGPLPSPWSSLPLYGGVWLDGNQLTGTIPEAWSETRLGGFGAQNNRLTGTVPGAWAALPLGWVGLTGNRLKGSLPESWSSTGLTGMSADFMGLTGTLPASWSALTGLGGLYLSGNAITGSFPEQWSTLTALRDIYIASSRLTGSLPASWSALTAFEGLGFAYNAVGGSIPPGLSALTRLTQLYWTGNQLTGPLPEGFSALTGMERMYLNNNQLRGTLPGAWSRLGALRDLSLAKNKLTGALAVEWSVLTHLQTMDLETNRLSGTVPAALSAMAGLQGIWFSQNLLSGTLPSALSALTNVRGLYASENLLTGPLPEAVGARTQAIDLQLNALTGTLPEGWSGLALQSLDLSGNRLRGSLPEAWSAFTAMQQLDLGACGISGTLPASWSAMSRVQQLILSGNTLQGSLPPSWSALTQLPFLDLSRNRLGGSLPPSWSALGLQELLLLSNSLTGTLPEAWSAMTSVHDLVLSRNSLIGTLPEAWSTLTSLRQLLMDSNHLTGTLPAAWGTLLEHREHRSEEECRALSYPWNIFVYIRDIPNECPFGIDLDADLEPDCWPPCNVPACGWLSACSSAYLASSAYSARVAVTDNRLCGTVPAAFTPADLRADLNCLSGWSQQEFFCPPRALAPAMLAACCVVAAGALLAATLALHGGLDFARRPLRTRYSASLLLAGNTSTREAPWVAAVATTLGWSLFSLTPAFGRVVIDPLLDATTGWSKIPEPVLRVFLRNLVVTLLPAALLLVAGLLWKGCTLLRNALRPSDSAWTLLASKDSLQENLSTVRGDQLRLLGLFSLIAAAASILNYLALPTTATVQVAVATPPALNHQIEPPVTLEASVTVSRSTPALFVASLLVVLYHAVACLTLPNCMWLNPAARMACRSAAAAGKADARLLRSLHWLRQAYWALLASTMVFAGTSAVCFWLEAAEADEAEAALTYMDYKAYKDRGDAPVLIPGTGRGALVGGSGLTVQLLLAALWNLCIWAREPAPCCSRLQRPGPNKRPDPYACECSSEDGEEEPTPHTSSAMSQAERQRNLLLAILGLHMVPVLGSDDSGWMLVSVVWGLTLALLAAVVLVRERPGGFKAIRGRPVFGLVLLASDLEAALANDLEAEEAEGEALHRHPEPPAECLCRLPEHQGGCPHCQGLLRRFPATLFRMQRALAVSYRWQASSRAIIRPPGAPATAATAGIRNGVVGLNMSRWQRRQLLAELRRYRHPYVWLDALCIPAAILAAERGPGGDQPAPGWLAHLSGTLLTRMMAVYAAADETLVLRSAEPDGSRYHQRAWTCQEYCGARRLLVRSEEEARPCRAVDSTLESFSGLVPVAMPKEEEEEEEDPESGGSALPAAFCPQEAAIFDSLRAQVVSRINGALPVWVQRLSSSSSQLLGPSERSSFSSSTDSEAPGSIGSAAGAVSKGVMPWLPPDRTAVMNGVRRYAAASRRVSCMVPADKVRALLPLLLNSPVQGADELRDLVGLAKAVVKQDAGPEDQASREAIERAWELVGSCCGDHML